MQARFRPPRLLNCDVLEPGQVVCEPVQEQLRAWPLVSGPSAVRYK